MLSIKFHYISAFLLLLPCLVLTLHVLLGHLVPIDDHVFEFMRLRALHLNKELWILRVAVNLLNRNGARALDLRMVAELV